jgi:hypothetical protein
VVVHPLQVGDTLAKGFGAGGLVRSGDRGDDSGVLGLLPRRRRQNAKQGLPMERKGIPRVW